MTLEIFFEKPSFFSLIIKKGQKVIDRADFEFNRNLERILISGLDKILDRNTISLFSLKKVKIVGSITKDSLSYQIAQSFKKALDL